jgi:hypothetical protein
MGEWNDPVYVFSQIMALCGGVCLVASYLQKKRVIILILGGLSAVFFTISYINLGGMIAAVSEIIVLLRNVAIYFIDSKRTNDAKRKMLKADWIMLAVTTVAVVIAAVFTWDSPWSVFILIGGMLYNFAICQKNIGIYCNLCLCGLLCYFVYEFYLGSLVSIIFDSFLFVGNVVGIIKYYRKRQTPRLANPQGIWGGK